MVATVETEIELAPRLRSAVTRIARSLRRTRAGADLTSTETMVLGSITRNGPVGLSKLARDEVMNPTMLSRVVRHLTELGFVARQSDPDDARAGLVESTLTGRKLDERIRTERADTLNRFINELGEEDRRTLIRALSVLERLAVDLKGRS